MTDPTLSHPDESIGAIVEDVLARRRAGEQIDVDGLIDAHPQSPHANLVTYHGVLAPAHRWRARIVQTIDARTPLPRRRPTTPDDDTTDATERIRRHTWAELMRRVLERPIDNSRRN